MTGIRLYNTRTRRKEDFTPLDPSNVRMYVCGPTVYDRAHLGNARPVVVFDVLFRLLRHVYGADAVTYVRNFTDVDDKINARAREMQAGGDGRDLNAIIRALTDQTIGWYHADMDELKALRPSVEPRATEYIGQMVGMIEGLVAKGHAYAAEGHVLFDVRSYPEYGRLSGRSVDDMIAGARVEVAPYKRDPMDFVLWKPSAADEPGWDSPWGRGRPGWHIECSAMAHELLGESFDIHGGGIDLQFPHHENEIAQSCCAHPEGGFARVWMHNEMVQVDGNKMSKSLGNFFTVRDLLSSYYDDNTIRFAGYSLPPAQGKLRKIDGLAIRAAILLVHYRSKLDFSVRLLDEAASFRRKITEFFRNTDVAQRDDGCVPEAVHAALCNDLDTRSALVAISEICSQSSHPDHDKIRSSLVLLGFMKSIKGSSTTLKRAISQLANALEGLQSTGVDTKGFIHEYLGPEYFSKFEFVSSLFDSKDDSNFDIPAGFAGEVGELFELHRAGRMQQVLDLLEARKVARSTKDFRRSDEIRDELQSLNITVRDGKDGQTWRLLK
ncbi:cysteine--tRNA ligase [Rhodobacteraceae bacterium 2376]|uniref:Cysteine--tRNA ligase n=1 Tax=Rhabdonatronobacter sediminivivens TaxID=2743469 RepID=A0A7Z0HVW1_9RHOB|nr:cysteine--tRNA ligase [Rhabdonatronobacter sediminivivens]NYS23358.1 cysteine--tRNA ligase [Rhabdonatronobacter sediminivivens]